MSKENKENKEKRLCSRTTFNAYVELWDKKMNLLLSGRMQDVSMFGLYVAMDEILPIGTLCEVKISILAKHSRLTIEDIQGKVVRYGEGGLGVSFTSGIEWFALFNVYSYYGRHCEVPTSQ